MSTHSVKHLVLSGGGVRGYALLGCLHYLVKKRIINISNIRTFVGSSVGAILALLLNCRYTPKQIYEIAIDMDIKSMFEPNIQNLITHFGFDTGAKFVNLLRSLMEKAGFDPDITFMRLYNITKQKIIITATSLNKRTVKYFDYIQTPSYKVVDVIRASMGIPILFTTVKDTVDEDQQEHYVDGGMLDNFPLHLFSGSCKPTEILAIKFRKTRELQEHQQFTQIRSLEDVIIANIACLLEEIEHLKSMLSGELYQKSTIMLETGKYHMLSINADAKDKKKMFKMGQQCVKEYIADPNYVLLQLQDCPPNVQTLVWKYIHMDNMKDVFAALSS